MAQPDQSVLRALVFELDNMATQLPSLTESLLFVETESKHSLPIWTLDGRSLSFLLKEVNGMTYALLWVLKLITQIVLKAGHNSNRILPWKLNINIVVYKDDFIFHCLVHNSHLFPIVLI